MGKCPIFLMRVDGFKIQVFISRKGRKGRKERKKQWETYLAAQAEKETDG